MYFCKQYLQVSDVKYRLIVFRRIAAIANLRSRKIYGSAILLSKFHYGITCFAGSDKTALNRLEHMYDKCLAAIVGRIGDGDDFETVRRSEGLLSFSELVDFYDITTFVKMMRTGKPRALREHVITAHSYGTRGASDGTVKLDFIPKSHKLLRTYLPRAYIKYNKIPSKLKFETRLCYLAKEVKAYLLSMKAVQTPPLPPSPSTQISPNTIQTANFTQIQTQNFTATTNRPPPEPD